MRRAKWNDPLRACSTIFEVSFGISFEQTETRPSQPRAISGMVVASSPDKTLKFFGLPARISITCEKFPDASFVATMLSNFAASLSVVAAEMFDDVLPG